MRSCNPRGERGVALLLVLWVFMVLGVIALDFARFMRDEALAAVNGADESRGYYVALAGMNRAIFELEQAEEDLDLEDDLAADGDEDEFDEEDFEDDEDEDDVADEVEAETFDDADLTLADGTWREGELWGTRFAVRVVDEGGRISLRHAGEVLLTRMVTNLVRGGNATAGVDRRAAADVATVVDSILDWVDRDDLERPHGAESAYYLAQPVPYRAKNGWLDSPEELLLVRGVTAALFYGTDGQPGLRDVVSVYSRSAQVNLRTVQAPVLQVLLGLDADAAEELLVRREDEGSRAFAVEVRNRLLAIDPALAETRLANSGARVIQIEARADIDAERNVAHVAAVVDLASELTDGVRVLRWLDRGIWEGALPPAPEAR